LLVLFGAELNLDHLLGIALLHDADIGRSLSPRASLSHPAAESRDDLLRSAVSRAAPALGGEHEIRSMPARPATFTAAETARAELTRRTATTATMRELTR
jgi:hypothetical protein